MTSSLVALSRRLSELLDFDAVERMAVEKKDAYRFDANPDSTEKIEDGH